MSEQMNHKNLIIGVGGAGTNFLSTAQELSIPNTILLGMESIEDLLQNEEFLIAAEKVFIVGSFGAPDKTSAFYITESILSRIKESNKKIHLIIILPFLFEGRKRRELSMDRVKIMQDLGYEVLTFDNQSMVHTVDLKTTSLKDGFKILDKNICNKIAELL